MNVKNIVIIFCIGILFIISILLYVRGEYYRKSTGNEYNLLQSNYAVLQSNYVSTFNKLQSAKTINLKLLEQVHILTNELNAVIQYNRDAIDYATITFELTGNIIADLHRAFELNERTWNIITNSIERHYGYGKSKFTND